jgi:hypothetical protein
MLALPKRHTGQARVTGSRGDAVIHRRYDDRVPLRDMAGDLDALALYAGQSVGTIHGASPAADVVHQLVARCPEVMLGLGKAIGD